MSQPIEVWITQGLIIIIITLIYLLRHYLIKYNVFGKIGESSDKLKKRIENYLKKVAETSKLAAAILPHVVYFLLFAFICWMLPYPGVAQALLPVAEIFIPVLRTLIATNSCVVKELNKCSMYWVVWACMMILRTAWGIVSGMVPSLLIPQVQVGDTVTLCFVTWLQAPFGGLSSIYDIAAPFIHEKLQVLAVADRFVNRIISFAKGFSPATIHWILDYVHQSWLSLLALFTLLAMYPISLFGLLYVAFAVPAIKSVNAISSNEMDVQIHWLGFFAVYSVIDLIARALDLWNWIPLGFGVMFHTIWVLALQVPPLDLASRVFDYVEARVLDLIGVVDAHLHPINPRLSMEVFGVASLGHKERRKGSNVKSLAADDAKTDESSQKKLKKE
jgi:hypothetical protein